MVFIVEEEEMTGRLVAYPGLSCGQSETSDGAAGYEGKASRFSKITMASVEGVE